MEQSKQNKNNNQINKQGLIDQMESAVKDIVTPIMKTVEPLGEVAGALGMNMLDNPTMALRNEEFRLRSNGNVNMTVGPWRGIPLVVDPTGTSVTPKGAHKYERVGGLTDLMSIPIASESTGATGVINNWTTSMLPGTILYRIPVGPLFELYDNSTSKQLTPLSTFASLYDLWHGDLIYDIEMWHTAFNKGAIAAAFWNYQTDQMISVDLTAMSHSNLIQTNLAGNTTRLRIVIPFKHQMGRLFVYNGDNFDACFTGSLVIFSLTALQTKQGFPDVVPFVVRVSSDNIKFSNHSLIPPIAMSDWPTAVNKMDFVRQDYPAVPFSQTHSTKPIRSTIKRQGEGDKDEGNVETTKDVYHESGYGKAVEDIIKPVARMRVTPGDPTHSSITAAQDKWDIEKVFKQGHILDYVISTLPDTEGPIRFFPLPNSAMVDETLSPCISRKFRFYTYESVQISLALNTMNGVAGAGFMVYLPGITSEADAQSLLTGAGQNLQKMIDMNGGVIFPLSTDREIHLDCPNVYPLNNFSVDTRDNCGTVVIGLYTPTYLGVGQTGDLNFTVKAAFKNFQIREPNFNPNTATKAAIERQGEHSTESDATEKPTTSTVDHNNTEVADEIRVNPMQVEVRRLGRLETDHTDSVMSFEQLKRFVRVSNTPLTNWEGSEIDIWNLVLRHPFIYAVLRMIFLPWRY
jgi:hypothetical protein